MRYRGPRSFDTINGDTPPFGGVAPFGGVPGFARINLFDSFAYTAPAGGDLIQTVAPGIWSGVSGGVRVYPSPDEMAGGYSAGVGGLQIGKCARAAGLSGFSGTRDYDLRARVRIESGTGVTITAEGRFGIQVTDQGSLHMARLTYSDAAAAPSASYNLPAPPIGPSYDTYDVVMRVRSRVASLTVNGISAVTGYALVAYGGTPDLGLTLAYFDIHRTSTGVEFVRLTQY